MKFFQHPGGNAAIVLGSGIVGSAVVSSLVTAGFGHRASVKFDWSSISSLIAGFEAMRRCVAEQRFHRRLDVCWAAGSAGFSASEAQSEEELVAYRLALSAVCDLSNLERPVAFHLISSAGGLYEGLRVVDGNSDLNLSTPYGRLKRSQEQAALATDAISTLIYRPSTIYGYGGPSARIGLVSAVLMNIASHRVTNVFGRSDTMRDYVLADDIGAFVTRKIVEGAAVSEPMILASARPATISEIVRLCEMECGTRAYVQYTTTHRNASHNSFRKSALPDGWKSTDLSTGIRRLFSRMTAERKFGEQR